MVIYAFYILISPILSIILLIISFFNFKVRSNLFSYLTILRTTKKALEYNEKTVLLFHATSIGEFEQLKPILKRINRTKFYVVQSFTSPSIYNKSNLWEEYVDIGCYQPFDCLLEATKFFKIIKPALYIVTRHDLWPNYVITAKR